MNIDTEYSRAFFDAWIDGLENMKIEKDLDIPSNAGSMPEFPKARL